MATTSVFNGSVDVNQISLSSLDGKKNMSLIGQVVTINIFEEIFCPIVYAEIDIVDSADLRSSFPLIGEEVIDISFRTAGNKEFISYKFFAYKISNAVTNKTDRVKTYTIKCCSMEILKNSTLKLNQRISGSSETIIGNILSNSQYLNSDKQLSFEQTKGPQDLLFSKISPFQAIDLIRRRSVSQKYISSSFCFFENRRGFNFCTIEFLLDQGKDYVKDKIFWYDSLPEVDAKNVRVRNILAMRNTSSFDTANKLQFGGLNNIVRKFDIFTGELSEITFNNYEKQDQFKFASDNPTGMNSSFFEQNYGSESGYSMLVPHRSDLADTFIPDSLGARQAFVQKIIQNLYQIHTYGDSEITAGDVIKVNVPSGKGTTSDQAALNKLLAGNYLVSRLRHTIAMEKHRLYTNSMELIKGWYEDNI